MSVIDIANRRQLASAPGDSGTDARRHDRNLETSVSSSLSSRTHGSARDLAPAAGKRGLKSRNPAARITVLLGSFSLSSKEASGRTATSFQQPRPMTVSTQTARGLWNAECRLRKPVCRCGARLPYCLAVSPPVCERVGDGDGKDYTVSDSDDDASGIACLAAKIGSLIEIKVTEGGRSTPFATSQRRLSFWMSRTAHVSARHRDARRCGAHVADPLTAPGSLWCASKNYWNGSPFSVVWLDDPGT